MKMILPGCKMNIKQLVLASGIVVAMGALALDCVEVTDVAARQRYPWNGLVDSDFDLSCKLGALQIPLSLVVNDEIGGTNLPCRTLWVDGVAAEQIQVQSGHHRVTWDADADLPDGFECDRVTVEVKAE